MAVALKCLMDVKVQDAKWFHLIVSLAIILRVNNKYLVRTSQTWELFSGIQAYELAASTSTHQHKKFLVSNFEETNDSSFSSPVGGGIVSTEPL